ncbi:hypothetical protein SUDANB66_06051 [Streptomyces sp. SudanB66_2053]
MEADETRPRRYGGQWLWRKVPTTTFATDTPTPSAEAPETKNNSPGPGVVRGRSSAKGQATAWVRTRARAVPHRRHSLVASNAPVSGEDDGS